MDMAPSLCIKQQTALLGPPLYSFMPFVINVLKSCRTCRGLEGLGVAAYADKFYLALMQSKTTKGTTPMPSTDHPPTAMAETKL